MRLLYRKLTTNRYKIFINVMTYYGKRKCIHRSFFKLNSCFNIRLI
jgi:hypothetical protein